MMNLIIIGMSLFYGILAIMAILIVLMILPFVVNMFKGYDNSTNEERGIQYPWKKY